VALATLWWRSHSDNGALSYDALSTRPSSAQTFTNQPTIGSLQAGKRREGFILGARHGAYATHFCKTAYPSVPADDLLSQIRRILGAVATTRYLILFYSWCYLFV